MPFNVVELNQLLVESNYPARKRNFVVQGFKYGFSLKYHGPQKVRRYAPNLMLRSGNKYDLWNKVMTEVQANRYAGPFDEVPFDNFIQSPIGLVPKDKGTKTRLIFHLSYPKHWQSVNTCIPEKFCKVKYPDFKEAIQMCLIAGKVCSIAKSDMARAFRNVPLNKASWKYLVLKCQHPQSGKMYYFVDKCLPFGSSISCAIFQAVSNSIAHIVKFRAHLQRLLNYLDDYFFATWGKVLCDQQVQVFLQVCEEICFPVSLEKTFWGTTLLVFLGLLINTIH